MHPDLPLGSDLDGTIGGWKGIAQAMGYSDRNSVRALAKREDDPLPVRRRGKGVMVLRSELYAWLKRQPMVG